MKLHKVKKRTAEPQNIEYRMSKDGIASLNLFLKLTEYITSKFDIHYSKFDIRFFRVSFPIKLAAPQPAAALTPET